MFAEYQLRVKDFISPSDVIYKNIKKSIENLPSGTDEEDWGQITVSVYKIKRCLVLLCRLYMSVYHSYQCEGEEEWEDSWIFIWTNKQGGVPILPNIDSWACDASLYFLYSTLFYAINTRMQCNAPQQI